MSIFEAIVNHFNAHVDASSQSIETLTPHIAEAAHLLSQTLIDGGKILCASSANNTTIGQQFCHNLIGNTELERPSLPAIMLNNSLYTTSDTPQQHHAISSQLQSLGQAKDTLILFSASGDELPLLHALNCAQERQLNIVSITSGLGDAIALATPKNQVHIALTGYPPYQAASLQFLLVQLLCELLEQQLFGALAG